MACEINRPNPQDLFNRIRDQFSNVVLQGSPVIPESNEWYVVSLEYAMAEEFYSFAEQQWKERDPRTACCSNLIDLAAQDGVFLQAATFAQGYIKLTGTAGAALPSSIRVNIGGVEYETVGTLPAAIPDSGEVYVRVRANEAGSQGNITTNSTGTIVGTIPGVNQQVELLGSTFCGGEDEETCEQLRSRYTRRLQFSPRANQEWASAKIQEWPCVTRVCVRSGSCCRLDDPCGSSSCSCCGNTLDYYVFMDNTFDCGIPPRCVLDEIEDWLFGPSESRGYGLGQMEMGVCGAIHSITPVPVEIRVSEYGCISGSQQREIEQQLVEFFKTLCPSTELPIRALDQIVGSVLGATHPFTVEILIDESDLDKIERLGVGCNCGLEMRCDVLTCLDKVSFVDDGPVNACAP